ncbi:MAG: S9 family peptidase [candidate division Zixibacteria bacterium]
MKYLKNSMVCVAVICAFLASGCSQNNYHEVKKYTIEQFLNTTSLFGASLSHDETKILFTSNISGVYNAYTVPMTGGDAQALTHSDSNSIYAVSFFPFDNRIIFDSDQGGNEVYHLYVRNEDGSVIDLIDEPEARATFAGWSHDLKSFFYECNRRDPRFMDIYEMELGTMTSQMIYQNDRGYTFGDISNDKRYIVFSKSRTMHDADIYLYDNIAGEMKHITPHEGEIDFAPRGFSVDSKYLYYLTDENSEFKYLARYDISSGISDAVKTADWDIMYSYFSYKGKYRVIGVNNDAKTEIEILNTETGELINPPDLPDADITSVGFSRSEKYMTFYMSGSRSPSDLYIYNLETGEYNRLTNSMNPEIDPQDLVDAEVVRFKSFDGLEIPGILYKPHLKPGEMAPALVWVHGGPGGQSRVGYNSTTQYLVNHGYVVLAINNRGSRGYGKTFYKLDDLNHGKGDLDDCVMAKEYFASTGFVDTSRVGILGGSYGGYMVLAAMAFRPDEFDVGVDIFGVSNWVRTLKSIPAWWEDFKEALYKELGNPETQEDYLRSISPLFHAEKIKKPLIILQGANDPRVLQVESDEIVEAVKKNGVLVEYIVFEDEGHGFSKRANNIEGWEAILGFLDKNLKNLQ